jgi:hypothetical protein
MVMGSRFERRRRRPGLASPPEPTAAGIVFVYREMISSQLEFLAVTCRSTFSVFVGFECNIRKLKLFSTTVAAP